MPILANAIHSVGAMSFQGRIDLTDRIHAEQPTLLYSVLVMQRFGATMVQIEALIELLLVAFTAMKAAGGKWPVISEGLQERCPARVGGRARFIEGLDTPQVDVAIHDAFVKHPEAPLLAHALDMMRRQGWLGIVDDTQKHLVLVRPQPGGVHRRGGGQAQAMKAAEAAPVIVRAVVVLFAHPFPTELPR
jgi:hypothetical protein